MGLAGGFSVPRPVSRERIEREGLRLHYDGEALEDFVLIVLGIDDIFVEVTAKKEAARASAAARKASKQRGA